MDLNDPGALIKLLCLSSFFQIYNNKSMRPPITGTGVRLERTPSLHNANPAQSALAQHHCLQRS